MIDYGHTVYLSPLDLTYCDTLFRWRNDFRIRRYCRQNDLLTYENHTQWMKSIGSNPTKKMYFARRKSDQMVIGVCGLTSLDLLNRRAEFSLYIAPEYQKAGHGKASLITLVSHGFNAYGLLSIWGEAYSNNPGRALFPKVGFKVDGVRRSFYVRERSAQDAVLYSILKSDWETSPTYLTHREERCFI